MQGKSTVFKANNRPLFIVQIILSVFVVIAISHFRDSNNLFVLAGIGVLVYLLLIVCLTIAKNRTVFIVNNNITVRVFRTDIFLDLNRFSVTVFMKKDRVNYFQFESNSVIIKIYPATYLDREGVLVALNNALRENTQIINYHSVTD